MNYKVNLVFFNDDANGEWGLAHFNSINRDQSFNAFWSGNGMFHDVFEHYYEGVHPFFQGNFSFNVGGEVAAMGHRTYYQERFRPAGLMRENWHSIEDNIVNITFSDMHEAVASGNCNFGYTLECGVPTQKSVNSYMLDTVIGCHMYSIEELEIGGSCHEEQEREFAQSYRESITEQKIHDLYTWGYKEAAKIADHNEENEAVIEDFIAYWETFCFANEAADMQRLYSGLEFSIEGGEELKWDAYFITHDGKKVHHLKHKMKQLELEIV